MIQQYRWFIQRLNGIQKVCIIHDMLMYGLNRTRRLASTMAWRPEVVQAICRLMAGNVAPAGLPT
jgi:hypothetical protein